MSVSICVLRVIFIYSIKNILVISVDEYFHLSIIFLKALRVMKIAKNSYLTTPFLLVNFLFCGFFYNYFVY